MLITGGSRGIGAATARLAAARGYAVAITYQSRQEAADATVAACRAAGGQAIALQGDVSAEDDVQRWFEETARRLGVPGCVINSAGQTAPLGRLEGFSAARVRRLLEVNVLGTVLCCREAVRRLSTRNGGPGGCIVNLSSAAAYRGSPGEYVDYAATKGAVDTLTIGLAKEVTAEGVRVNGVRPGLIETEIHAQSGEPGRVARLAPSLPMGRGGQPTEVAESILWLCSPSASYVSGALLNCTGGL